MQKIEQLLLQSKWTDEELQEILNAYADAIKSLEPFGSYYQIVVDTLRNRQYTYARIAGTQGHKLSSDYRIYEFDRYIKLNDCVDRILYSLKARNISVGVFDKESGSFIGIRSKFGNRYLDSENHWDAPTYASCKPLKAISELPTHITLSTGSNPELFDWLNKQILIQEKISMDRRSNV